MAQQTVTIKNMSFDPKKIMVKAGDEIIWKNTMPMNHTATANDGSFDTGVIQGNHSSKPIRFEQANPSIKYRCTIHPVMTGEIEVTP